MSFVFNPIDPEFLRDPYPTYERLRHEMPVYRHPAGFWVLSRYDDVTAVLKDAEVFSSSPMGNQRPPTMTTGQADAPGIGRSLLAEDPPVHTEQRNIVNRGFTPGRIAALEPAVRKIADELFPAFETRGHCDLTAEFANPLPVSVIVQLLGLDPARRDEFKSLSTDITVGATRIGEMGTDDILRSAARFRECVVEAVEDRKRNPGDDLVSVLVNAEVEDGILDSESTIGFAGLLLVAGSETTTNLIGNAMVSLMEDPEMLERVLADGELIRPLLEESLRHDPPVQVLMRLTTRETEIAGTPIPKGNMVMVSLGSANRDESRFAKPDVFDLDRNAQGHLAFGFGNHFCLGASLARLEARIAMSEIVARLQRPRLACPEVEYHGSFLIRGPRTLPIEFEGRAAA